ncbi:hypothetical protein M4914_01700 [Streptomyces somaliensis DSM 40738]|uniref:Uncharacterized protein n=1 Tax=Streptomyces somaliensis (strain ATCC 33201 / DSM 40738 / JCM 12659 / KCTC 9044 / NCTC 11332 / NRRL B-12077 / IP 733) TaxID=1134445 RepID=A0AA44DDK8_STRE0|nr:hypothetical protein [Streptomyces somaliensis]MCQ0021810.1 hypothetical protein [Streptomyces somaliensis DSM 40738]NKY14216.1 hypothetical protein [Streptomyces somaliensis DSM 40738]
MLGVLGAVGALTLSGSPAVAVGEGSGDTHCVTVVDGLEPGQKTSRVMSRKCFSGPGAAERADGAVSAAAAGTELMIWSEHANYGGVYDRIYGYDGPCDAAGYAFTPSTWWQQRLSSFQVHGGCNRSYASGPRGNGSFYGQVPYVGNTLNDAVSYIKVWNG